MTQEEAENVVSLGARGGGGAGGRGRALTGGNHAFEPGLQPAAVEPLGHPPGEPLAQSHPRRRAPLGPAEGPGLPPPRDGKMLEVLPDRVVPSEPSGGIRRRQLGLFV